MFHCTVIPRSYVVDGSETDIFSPDDVSRVTFTLKRNVKIWRVVPDNLFRPRGNYLHIKNVHKIFKLRTNDNLRRRRSLLNCRQVIWIIMSDSTGGNERVPDRITRKLSSTSPARWRPFLLLQKLLTTSKHHHNSLSSCCSLFDPISALKHLDASCSQPKPFSQLHNHHGPHLRLRLRFLGFFKGILLQNLNKTRWGWAPDNGECSTIQVFGRSNRRVWLNILGLRAVDELA